MNNTKLLVIFSSLLIISGSAFYFGKHTPTKVKLPASSSVPISTASAIPSISGERVLVTKVIDGDTIKVEMSGKEVTIRVLGVDTPETVDPRKPVQCFGKEASNEMKSLLSDKIVYLQKDVSNADKYNRLLRYVFLPLPDGKILFVDDYLVREGYAHVLTIPPDVKYSEQFLQAQKEARQSLKGLWGKC